MPECSSTPAEANSSISHTIVYPSLPTAVMVSDLAAKPEKSGKAEIDIAPMMQNTVVHGMDL